MRHFIRNNTVNHFFLDSHAPENRPFLSLVSFIHPLYIRSSNRQDSTEAIAVFAIALNYLLVTRNTRGFASAGRYEGSISLVKIMHR